MKRKDEIGSIKDSNLYLKKIKIADNVIAANFNAKYITFLDENNNLYMNNTKLTSFSSKQLLNNKNTLIAKNVITFCNTHHRIAYIDKNNMLHVYDEGNHVISVPNVIAVDNDADSIYYIDNNRNLYILRTVKTIPDQIKTDNVIAISCDLFTTAFLRASSAHSVDLYLCDAQNVIPYYVNSYETDKPYDSIISNGKTDYYTFIIPGTIYNTLYVFDDTYNFLLDAKRINIERKEKSIKKIYTDITAMYCCSGKIMFISKRRQFIFEVYKLNSLKEIKKNLHASRWTPNLHYLALQPIYDCVKILLKIFYRYRYYIPRLLAIEIIKQIYSP